MTEAARHPFLASVSGVGYLTPGGSSQGYPLVFVDEADFMGRPAVSAEILRMRLDPIALLKCGTTVSTPPQTRQVAQVTPLQVATADRTPKRDKQSSHMRLNGAVSKLEPNNNHVAYGQTALQPRPAHSGGRTAAVHTDINMDSTIDLTQSSPQSRHRQRAEVPAVPGPSSGVTSTPHSSKGVTEMFRSWENSLSKYIDKSSSSSNTSSEAHRQEVPWSGRARQEVTEAIHRGLGILPRPSLKSRFHPHQATGAPGRSAGELRSFALQANMIASSNKAMQDSVPKQESGRFHRGAMKSSDRASESRRGAANDVIIGNAHSSGAVKQRTHKRTMKGKDPAEERQRSDGQRGKKSAQHLKREPYCPQYSDISNSDSNFASSSTQSSVNVPGKHHEADINANNFDVRSRMTGSVTHAKYEAVTEDSDSTDSECEDRSAVPPKKRKRYRRTSSDCPDPVKREEACLHSPSESKAKGHSQPSEDQGQNKLLELKMMLLSQKAVIEENLSKKSWTKQKAKESDVIAESSHHSQQRDTKSSVYDFHPDQVPSPAKMRRDHAHTQRNARPRKSSSLENRITEIYEGRMLASSLESSKKRPAPSSRKTAAEHDSRDLGNCSSRRSASLQGLELRTPRRVSPRKHASTARLIGRLARPPINGLNSNYQEATEVRLIFYVVQVFDESSS